LFPLSTRETVATLTDAADAISFRPIFSFFGVVFFMRLSAGIARFLLSPGPVVLFKQ